MKKGLKITGRVLLGLLLVVYLAVAAVNYSVVQSYIGTAAGRILSREWGGVVKIGAMHAMPWDHLILNNVQLVAPDGDTILDVERLSIHFKKFPFKDMGLSLDRVYLKNGYYHLAIRENVEKGFFETNLQYIFDHYSPSEQKSSEEVVFTVDVNTLTLNHVHYKMDLPEIPEMTFDYGVSIAHMEFMDIVSRIKDIHVVNDDVTCRLLKMSTTERSGFVVNQIEGKVHVGPDDITVREFELRTPKTTVRAEVSMEYDGWESLERYEDNVRHDITLKEGTSVALSDAAYWAPWLWGCESQVDAQGHMGGSINDMNTDLMVYWGEKSGLLLTGELKNITRPDSVLADIEIERLWTRLEDLQPLFVLTHTDAARLPVLKHVGHIDLSARVKGGMQTISTVNINALSGIGDLRADALLTPMTKGGMRFNAEANSSGLRLNILQSDWLTQTGFALSAEGECRDLQDIKGTKANVECQLTNSIVRGNRVAPIDLKAELEEGDGRLLVQSTDSLARIRLQTEFALGDSIKSIVGGLDVERLDAIAFGLMPEQYGLVDGKAAFNIRGHDLDEMDGALRVNGVRMGSVQLRQLALDIAAHDSNKHITLQSPPLDIDVNGRFRYDELPLIARQIGHEALPPTLLSVEPLTDEEKQRTSRSHLDMHAHWKDDGHFMQQLGSDIMVARNTRLTASYNSRERMKVALRSDSIRMGTAVLADIGMSGRTTGNDYVLQVVTESIAIGDMNLMQRVDLLANSSHKRTLMGITWGEENTPSRGNLTLQYRDSMINVLQPTFHIGDTPWELRIDSLSLVNSDGLRIAGNGISVQSAHQWVAARLSLKGMDNDYVELTFNEFDLSGLSSIFLQDNALSLSGDIGGRFSMYGLTATPYFNANLMIDSCMVNQQSLGDVKLRSNWNAELNTLSLQMYGDQIDADGWIELGQQSGDMNFTVNFDRFDLGMAAPLLSSFSSRFEGRLHGSFDITGSLKRPLIVGEALVEGGALQLDMTGVTYYFNDSLQFTNNRIILDDFHLRDPRGNTAHVDGEIRYDDLSDIRLALQLQADNLLVLDRRQGDEFYGTVLASAEGTVSGPIGELSVDVSARTMPGCELTVPVNDQRQVKTQNYITFVNDQTEQTSRTTTQHKEQRLKLELDLNITPDVQLNLPMDFSELGVNVGASGSGDLHLSLDGSEEPQVLGSYEITSGTMKLSALSLFSKDFTLEPGSSLNFQGSLPDARFNLSAVYTQRVNLSTLTGGMNDMGSTQKYLQVEDVISIAGTLQEPTIGFDLRLPGADASVEEEVFAYIDRNSERDMLNQTISILAFGHFYNANAASTANGNIAASGSIGALNSILSDMTGVDIDVDYKMGNEITKDQLDVNISKDWGRWYLESTLGYGGENRELQSGDVNSAVIDALVGYRISPLVHLFAYNRTNTNDYTRMDLPYKQGVGLKLTKDFNSWKELFLTNKKK